MAAPKGNQNAKGNRGGGRPTKFDPKLLKAAEQLAKLGATDAELAEALEVNESTVRRWRKERIEFSSAIARGKMLADAKVADRLFERACGYEHKDVKIMMVDGTPQKIRYTRHYPPDTKAAIYWLKVRQTERWSDNPEDRDDGELDWRDLVHDPDPDL